MGYILLLVSWAIRTYGAVLEKGSPLDTPLAFQSDTVKNFLVLLWIGLLLYGSYRVFLSNGILYLLLSIFIYFLVLPLVAGFFVKR